MSVFQYEIVLKTTQKWLLMELRPPQVAPNIFLDTLSNFMLSISINVYI